VHTFGKYKYTLLYHNGERSLKTAIKEDFWERALKAAHQNRILGIWKTKTGFKKTAHEKL